MLGLLLVNAGDSEGATMIPEMLANNLDGAGDGGRTRDLQLGKLTLYH